MQEIIADLKAVKENLDVIFNGFEWEKDYFLNTEFTYDNYVWEYSCGKALACFQIASWFDTIGGNTKQYLNKLKDAYIAYFMQNGFPLAPTDFATPRKLSKLDVSKIKILGMLDIIFYVEDRLNG